MKIETRVSELQFCGGSWNMSSENMDVNKVSKADSIKTYRKFKSKRREKTRKTINQHSVQYVVNKIINNIEDNICSNNENSRPTEEPATSSMAVLLTADEETDINLNASYSKLAPNSVLQNELTDVEGGGGGGSKAKLTNKLSYKGYQIIDDNVLDEAIKQIACPRCFQTYTIEISKIKKQGLTFLLHLSCGKCE